MKEATGELNITVITVVAIAAISALFVGLIYPRIKNNITNQVNKTGGYNVTSSGDITT